jgi:hypothetical protein
MKNKTVKSIIREVIDFSRDVFRKKQTRYEKTFSVGTLISSKVWGSIFIVEKRWSQIMGFEYMILLNGELHGWVTHSLIKNTTQSAKSSRM